MGWCDRWLVPIPKYPCKLQLNVKLSLASAATPNTYLIALPTRTGSLGSDR